VNSEGGSFEKRADSLERDFLAEERGNGKKNPAKKASTLGLKKEKKPRRHK